MLDEKSVTGGDTKDMLSTEELKKNKNQKTIKEKVIGDARS